MKNQEIANQTAIYLQALPRCNMKTSCEECIALNVTEEEDRVVPVSRGFLFFPSNQFDGGSSTLF